MRHILLMLGIVAAVGGTVAPLRADDAQAPVRTGKERLTDKASDEQRVDDCKVPPARRTRPRPTTCSAP
jgi:hypothetical protein